MFTCCNPSHPAVVRFGFNPDSYSEAESAGSVNLGVSFLEGNFGSAPISVQLSLNTASGTAQGEYLLIRDYCCIQHYLLWS